MRTAVPATRPIAVLRCTHGPPAFLARCPRIARACVAALPLLAACTDRPVTLPVGGPAPQALPAAECTVNVHEQSMRCTDARRTIAGTQAGSGGAEEASVRLASSETAYDASTGTLTTRVTLQNLLRQSMMGTRDGATLAPVRVGFQQNPTVTAGEGTATVLGDGLDTFTAADQPYYSYSQILRPNQVSHPRTWTFRVSPGVTAFTFSVYVSAPLAETSLVALLIAEVWTGAVSTDWGTAGNWQNTTVPDSASAVTIPDDSLLASHVMPVLGADAQITDLNVGFASTLGLGGHTLRAWGNVDAVGTVTNGTLWMRGTGATLGGSVDELKVDGRVTLQRPVVSTGGVAVAGSGSLSVQSNGLFVQIP